MKPVWIPIGTGKWRLVYEDETDPTDPTKPQTQTDAAGFTVHDTNYTQDGKFKYQTHGKDGGHQPVIQDLACDEGRKVWKDYVMLPDGREGPAPFRSNSERNEYMKMTGHRIKEKGEKILNPLETRRRNLEIRKARYGS